MIALLRFLIPAALVLSVIYAAVSLWSRHKRRRKLTRDWTDEHGDIPEDDAEEEDFVEKGLDAYDGSFRRRLILLIYIVPVVIVAIIIYAQNYR
ncbi:hypothetical protein KM176_10005 [Pseudooceanicola sp. CBS1P-1]|uniref:Cation/multidrug efflux pump n=1 Tax=Pseudooceanicola albus TaxID=2692189 RepID=A0A6L7G6Z6_9RHOB|nr:MULTISPECIES: hypothetical protein [Pseudooceanicola]MBT9384192.1 hypothetical protein [Pseudooceanicola endophyticus]MXN19709.1 hypothetical protein [Pseudooceanicola albus]